ncbi:hypothetical protein PtB15_9B522 [Puccinia triticina]|nr:hypothetical protein PtB15_9B522 [Puccinia triticina]
MASMVTTGISWHDSDCAPISLLTAFWPNLSCNPTATITKENQELTDAHFGRENLPPPTSVLPQMICCKTTYKIQYLKSGDTKGAYKAAKS